MNAAAKLLVSMRRNQLDWRIGDLQVVARQNNIDWRHQKSSHCVFIREDGRTLSVLAVSWQSSWLDGRWMLLTAAPPSFSNPEGLGNLPATRPVSANHLPRQRFSANLS